MSNFLRKARWSKVDLVDRPADAHATFAIFKRDDEGDEGYTAEERIELAKAGHALEDGSFPIVTKSDLEAAVAAVDEAGDTEVAKRHIMKRAEELEALDVLPGEWSISKSENDEEEGEMPRTLSDEVRKGLPDDVQAYLTDLEAEVAKKAPSDDNPDDITKRDDIPEDIKKMFADQKAAAERAESIAKAERDLRLTKEWEARLSSLDALTLEDGVAKSFKELADTNPELAENVAKTLEGLNEQAQTSGLFEEIGKSASYATTGEGKLESIVKGIMAEDKVDEPTAWDLASQRHPEAYELYLAEKGV